jgi:two-component system sensor histidine kinase/response regulator
MDNSALLINVLYVDDEVHNLQAFKASFRRDFNIYTANSANQAKLILKQYSIHVLITDQRMPSVLGTELLAETVKEYPDQIRILLTAYTDVEAIIDAINRGHIFKYLQKPWNNDVLHEAIIEGYEIYDLKEKEKKLKVELQKSVDELIQALKKR